MNMVEHRIFAKAFSSVYPIYVHKADRKGRAQDEMSQVYDQLEREAQVSPNNDFESCFSQAPAIHLNAVLIKGAVCGGARLE